MVRKRILLVILLTCLWAIALVALTPAPVGAGLDVNLVVPAPYLVVTAQERDAGDLLLLTALAAFFDADVHVVVPLYPKWSIHDIVLILAIGHHSHRELGYIVRMRERHGWGWGQIAHRLGVHPGAFNKQRVWAKKNDKAIGEQVLVRSMAGYWGLPVSHVKAMRGRNYPAREIALAANVAAQSGKPFGDVLKARASKQSWKDVSARAGADPSQLNKPVKAKGRHGAAAKGKPAAASQQAGKSDKPGGKAASSGAGKGKGGKPDQAGKGKGKGAKS